MAHIVISYDDIERIYGATFSGRRITRIKIHPWMARCLMVEFPGDPEDEPEVPTLDELIKTTEEKHGR